ncbi:GDP-L-fucose synthase family protein [Pukyongiella litopenaei]|uniref:GDP-L-fucose synthase n=1 Tax=Pukyongiella litopenaei TaxID=2605946 RepID=A0A2S0MSP6_9RHOB|nr:GDP-L-fucose synthase [Pukyongiella litopenaei]AVO38837.1 GDP-L-fucose synthase [Pukyongiella litopenaei]
MTGDPYRYDLAGKRIWVAGHRGMVGSAITRRLGSEDVEILTAGRDVLDLRDQGAVRDWIGDMKPDAICLAAAKVGGILANDRQPAEFLSENLAIQSNVIDAAHSLDVQRLLFLGSTCIYPRLAPQPMPEDCLLTGPLEPTNEWYAIAKIAGLKLCQAYRRQYGRDYISAMPTNLYGPGDNYSPNGSHVLPAFIARMHAARTSGTREVEIWGSGTPRREFLHVDDLADALVFLLRSYSGEVALNVGVGDDISIADLARLVAEVVGAEVELTFDRSKPDGTPRKLVDVTRLTALGWQARIPLREGLERTYRDYLAALDAGAVRGH